VPLASTPSQTVGPFFSFGLCVRPGSELVAPGAEGSVRIEGRVLDGAGDPVPDGLVELWQADRSGAYRDDFGWGRSPTDADGRFSFVTVKPGRVQSQAPHLTVLVFARGLLKQLHTRMYFPDEDEANAADPVLAALPPEDRATVVAVADADADTLRFDIRLQGELQTVFFAA
jgi:protocatechuate 3,4-dioxygenase alpha subunit